MLAREIRVFTHIPDIVLAAMSLLPLVCGYDAPLICICLCWACHNPGREADYTLKNILHSLLPSCILSFEIIVIELLSFFSGAVISYSFFSSHLCFASRHAVFCDV